MILKCASRLVVQPIIYRIFNLHNKKAYMSLTDTLHEMKTEKPRLSTSEEGGGRGERIIMNIAILTIEEYFAKHTR